MRDYPWIKSLDGTGKDAYAILCERCGTKLQVATPISIDCYVALSKAFIREHKRCVEGAGGSRQNGPVKRPGGKD